MSGKTISVEVISYDESTDTFEVTVPCPYTGRDEEINRVDVDDFNMPTSLFFHLVGEFGKPEVFVGNTYTLPSRA